MRLDEFQIGGGVPAPYRKLLVYTGLSFPGFALCREQQAFIDIFIKIDVKYTQKLISVFCYFANKIVLKNISEEICYVVNLCVHPLSKFKICNMRSKCN